MTQPQAAVPFVPARAGRRLGRSAAALIAGIVFTAGASYGTDAVMAATGLMSEDRTLPLSGSTALVLSVLAYRTLFNVGGCYLAGRLAPIRPLGHAVALGVLGTFAGIGGALAGGDAAPTWYGWGLAGLALPAAVVGGLLARRHHRELFTPTGEQW